MCARERLKARQRSVLEKQHSMARVPSNVTDHKSMTRLEVAKNVATRVKGEGRISHLRTLAEANQR